MQDLYDQQRIVGHRHRAQDVRNGIAGHNVSHQHPSDVCRSFLKAVVKRIEVPLRSGRDLLNKTMSYITYVHTYIHAYIHHSTPRFFKPRPTYEHALNLRQ